MNGYEHTAYDTIEDLRRNLRDRYKGCHAVLKELLQNADDAGATELHIAWLPAVARAEHVLLRGPILAIVNNGPFTYRDSCAIHLAGAGSKGHEEAKIGKFGLGLKSVFHLCEAFFYVSDLRGDDAQADAELKRFGRTGILNPWCPKRYTAWDDFSAQDRTRLRDYAQSLVGMQNSQWLGIYLPLRREAHCREDENDDPASWAIEPRYYGDTADGTDTAPLDDIFSHRRIAGLRQMLPLMSTLKRVCFWRSTTTDERNHILLAEITRNAVKHADWRAMKVDRETMAGSIDIAGNAGDLPQLYAGVQELLAHKELSDLKTRSDWPRIDAQTNTGRRREPAGVMQHAGVVVMEQHGGGSLRISEAVFLPLGDSPHPELHAAEKYGFELMLHGYFFVDAGRLRVDFSVGNERPTVRQEWNRMLYEEGTLPLVIPALAEYARVISGQVDVSRKLQCLTSLLAECQLWRDHCASLCRDSNWIFRLFTGGGRWTAAPNDLPLVLLPGGEQTDPGLPFAVFPTLAHLEDSFALSFIDLPRLARTDAGVWPDGLTEQMLQAIPLPEVVNNDAKLGYLCHFCEHLCLRDREHYLPVLIELLRRLLREVPLSDLRKKHVQVSKLMQLLPPGRALSIPFKPDLVRESERVFQALVDQEIKILPVPDTFLDPQAPGVRTVETHETRVLLEVLSQLRPAGTQEEEFHTLIGQVLRVVLSAWKSGPEHLLNEFGSLPLFYTKDYSCDRRIPLSARELQAHRARGLVFAESPESCKKLQACLEEDHVLFLAHSEIVRLLTEAIGSFPPCDALGCAELLAKRPRLTSDIPPRVALLRGMLRAWTDSTSPKLCESLRYVLHGQQGVGGQNISLYAGGDDAWCLLTQCILKGLGQSWRLVPKALVGEIPPSIAGQLNLVKCSSSSVPTLLENMDVSCLDCSSIILPTDLRDEIIRGWPEEAKNSLKRLPIYTRSDGTITSITNQTFIKGDFPPPPVSVFPHLILIDDESGAINARGLAPTLSPEDVLLRVLAQENCHHHWRFILDSIPESVSDELRKELRKAAWLPAPDGTGCSPSVVICRDSLLEYVRRLRECARGLLHRQDLPMELLSHGRWQAVETLCPQKEELYRCLGEALKSVPAFAVGENTVRDDSLDIFIELFGQDNGDEVMPAAGLFRALRESGAGGTQWIARHMLPAVKHSVEMARSKEVLKYLSRQHEVSTGPDRRLLLDAFNRYLRENVRQPTFREHLPELRFLNQESRWCSPITLAVSGSNIAATNLLHVAHADAIGDAFSGGPEPKDQEPGWLDSAIAGANFDPTALARSASILGDYLDTWRSDDVPDDALAAVVSMLGDHNGFPKLYERLRDTRSLSAMRGIFSWEVTGPGWRLRDLMDKQLFYITPADAKTVDATNLLCEHFSASVSKQITSLFDGFDGHTYFRMPDGCHCYVIRLRQIDPEELSSEEKLRILGNTVQAIRSLIHKQHDEDFQAVWSRITHVGQLDLEVAQEMILESSAMLLETQLSVRNSAVLTKLFDQWYQVRLRAKTAATDDERGQADADRHAVLESLRQLLRNDTSTQTVLVDEIRKRLDAASYTAASIPFELFQNADDALVELEFLCNDGALLERTRPASLRSRFVATVDSLSDKTVLRFIHWGRGINQFRIGASDGRDRGFDRDMERMLVLQGSGKNNAEGREERTGKFGLGFKSVFFVCDAPCVLSGSRSRFRVLAGVYPDRLSDEDERQLEEVLDDEGDPRHTGTVVELSLREPKHANNALSRFRELAGYLVVFARRVRQCSLGHPAHLGSTCRWEPDTIFSGVEAGVVQVGPSIKKHVVAFRLGPDFYRTVLVPINAHGVSSDVFSGAPEVWVTTPTEHKGAGSLLVNGPFDLNPGRTQLRETDNNIQIAMEMGCELGERLCHMYQQFRNGWADLRKRIGCQEASWDEFWSSLWSTCAPYANRDSGSGILHRILFGSEHCGMHRLIREADALPSGLPDRYARLTSLPNIRWRIRGILAQEDVWRSVMGSTWVHDNIQPGTVVAQEVATVLDRFCRLEVRDLTLALILKGTLSNGPCAPPEIANELGRFIFSKRLQEMEWDHLGILEKEVKEIREILATVQFRTMAGGWSAAADLLIGHDPTNRQEEYHQAAFAPQEYLLSREYSGDALEFFMVCRRKMQVSPKQMAEWIREADDLPRRKAGLAYLGKGGFDNVVLLKLMEPGSSLNGTWLDDPVARRQAMQDMDADHQAALMGMLRKANEIEPPSPPSPGPITKSPRAVLRDILAWWREEKEDILAYHDHTVYPQGHVPHLLFSASTGQLESDVAVRREWLILFMLGAMYRIGRVTLPQNRGFLDLCGERGWLEVLADRTDDPSPWFRIMDDYLDSLQGDAPYYHWMNQFLAYYQLSRWLPSYARAFDAVTRPQVDLTDLASIRDIADLRTSHIFSGSTGFDAPPCSRTLGLGSHFVLRETIRIRAAHDSDGHRSSSQLRPMAFVPSRAVRRFLAQILSGGDASDAIDRAFLLDQDTPREHVAKRMAQVLRRHLGEDAIFDGSFDIPLLVLTWKQYSAQSAQLLGSDYSEDNEVPLDFLRDSYESEDNVE